jgi:hypothetical protein
LWYFVDNKGNKQWVWLALDADTREIVGIYIGGRDEAAARQLWQSLPPVYRHAQLHTRTFGQPMGLFYRPNDRKAVGKETGSHQLH